MAEFLVYGIGKNDAPEQLRQNLDLLDEDQVNEGAGVSYKAALRT